jgi:hypothetical protein
MQNNELGKNQAGLFKVRSWNRILLITGIIFMVACCNTEINSEFKSRGVITGPDLGMCICCGGWHIMIDGETYNFESIPGTSDINLQKETFPVNVKLDWVSSGSTGCPGWIVIQKIVKE